MWGRISASAKARARLRTSRCSSVRVKSITALGSLCCGRRRSYRRRLPPSPVRDTRPDAPAPSLYSAGEHHRGSARSTSPPSRGPTCRRSSAATWTAAGRHGVGHRLYDTAGREYLDFANGIAVTALGHAHPRVTAADPRPGRPADRARSTRWASRSPTVRLARMLADTFPDPLDSVLFLNSGSETIDGALKLARRVTGRPGIIAFRGAFHGRTFGATSVTTSSLNYRTGYEPLLPGVYFAPVPGRLPASSTATRRRPTASSLAILQSLLGHDHRAVAGRRDPDRAGPGRGRLLPGAGRVPARAARAVRRARDPADRRRGPVGLRPDGRDVGVRARGDRPRRRVRREGDRQRPAAVGDRDPARARRALGPRRARLDVRRQPGRLRGRRRRAGDDPRRAAGRERARPRAPS